MILIDYVYYKITRLYLKSEGQYSITAILSISFAMTLLLIDLILPVYNYFFTNPHRTFMRDIVGQEIVIYEFIVLFFLYRRYKKGYYFFRNQFQNENRWQSFLGWIYVVLFHFLPFYFWMYLVEH